MTSNKVAIGQNKVRTLSVHAELSSRSSSSSRLSKTDGGIQNPLSSSLTLCLAACPADTAIRCRKLHPLLLYHSPPLACYMMMMMEGLFGLCGEQLSNVARNSHWAVSSWVDFINDLRDLCES